MCNGIFAAVQTVIRVLHSSTVLSFLFCFTLLASLPVSNVRHSFKVFVHNRFSYMYMIDNNIARRTKHEAIGFNGPLRTVLIINSSIMDEFEFVCCAAQSTWDLQCADMIVKFYPKKHLPIGITKLYVQSLRIERLWVVRPSCSTQLFDSKHCSIHLTRNER